MYVQVAVKEYERQMRPRAKEAVETADRLGWMVIVMGRSIRREALLC